MRKVLSFVLVAVLLLTAAVPTFAQDRPTLSEVLESGELGNFTTLLAALDAAGLSETLSGEGPFTILAPTDEAIAASLETMGMTPEALMANPDALESILLYHVIPGRYFFRNLTSGPTLDTALEGESVTFALDGGAFTVNGVNISNIDNLIDNGIVFVLDGVLVPPSLSMAAEPEAEATEVAVEPTAEPTSEPVVVAPPARPSIAEVLASGDIGNFTTLLAAIDLTGLGETLSGEGPFTVFAPTDEAFAALLEDLDLDLMTVAAQPDLVRDILLYHVVPGRYFFRNLTSDPTLETALEGQTIAILQEGNTLTANDANIIDVDNLASNGIIFVIDSVLLTPEQMAVLAPSGAHIRAAHFSPDAGAVDVYVNGDLELENVSFGAIGDWMDIRPGDVTVAIAPTGTEPGEPTTVTVAEGDWITIAASGTAAQDSIVLNVLREDYSAVPENRVRLSVFHGIESAGAVDVFVNGQLLIGALGYPGSLGDNDGFDIREVGAGSYDVQVRLAGTETVVYEQAGVAFGPGENVLIGIIGTPGQPSIATSATVVQ